MQWLIDIINEQMAAYLGIPPVYVDRGDYQDTDYAVGDFTQDNNWYELDLSTIVPAGAAAVKLHVKTRNNNVGTYLRFRKHGHTGNTYRCTNRTQVANVIIGHYLVVSLDAGRKIDYYVAVPAFLGINLTVQGWWLGGF